MAPSRVMRCPIGRRFKPEQVPPGRGPAAALGLAPDHGVTETGVAEASTNDHTAIVDRSGRANPKPSSVPRSIIWPLRHKLWTQIENERRTGLGPLRPAPGRPRSPATRPAGRGGPRPAVDPQRARRPRPTGAALRMAVRALPRLAGRRPGPRAAARPLTAETPTPGTPATVPATGQRLTQARHLADQPPTNPSHAHPEGSWAGTGPSASRIHATQGLPPQPPPLDHP
jgi:hypothetical protein